MSAASGLAVVGGQVVGPDATGAADVVVQGGSIVAVGPPTVGDGGAVATLDASGLLVAPGYVDLQCNGGYGIDLARRPEQLWELAARLPATGVTAFLPTIVSSPAATVDRALAALADRPDGFSGAEPLGLHLEGPMLSPPRRGAHVEHHLRLPEAVALDGWTRAAGVALVTLAPELPGGLDAVARLRAAGVVVSAGHTSATTDEAAAAVEAGVTVVTHLFNAMAPFAHREPGTVGVALADDRVSALVIVDGLHLHPVTVAAAWRALGPERLVLVTDAVVAMGADPGGSDVGGMRVTVGPDGVRTADGRLAGSLLTMDAAVRNLVQATGCSPRAAIASATAGPARVLGDGRRGAVVAGRRADLVLLDADLAVAAVVVGGQVVVDRDGRHRPVEGPR